jgi:hypothetical protein
MAINDLAAYCVGRIPSDYMTSIVYRCGIATVSRLCSLVIIMADALTCAVAFIVTSSSTDCSQSFARLLLMAVVRKFRVTAKRY